MRRTLARLVALLRRTRLDDELDGEIRAHLELAERDARAAGMRPDDARREALRRFGRIEPMREAHRDSRSARWLEAMAKDARFGLTVLRRAPGFATIAIALLALGIGANAATFSLLDAVLFKALPYPEPDRIVRVWETPTPTSRNGATTLNVLDWKRLTTSFEAMSVERPVDMALAGHGEPVRIPGLLVSSDYFTVFGIRAARGRTFHAQDDGYGAMPVVVISHALWRTHFGEDASLVGRDVILDGVSHTVVGVLPAGSFDRTTAAFWKPLVFREEDRNRENHWLGVVGRLRVGVSLERAQEDMQAVSAGLQPLQPEWKRAWGVAVDPFDRNLVQDNLRDTLYLAFGAVCIVLFIACANLANLLLARGVQRRREVSVRAALGASRGRIARQFLTEALVLCTLGGLAGVALAYVLLHMATPYLPTSVPATADITLDGRVLAFSGIVSLVVAIAVGVFPAWQAADDELSGAMRNGSRGSSPASRTFRGALVVGEVALSLVLLVAALSLVASLQKLQAVDLGVRVEHVVTMSTDLPLASYPTAEHATNFIGRVREALEAVPGVQRAGVATGLPLLGVREGQALWIPGQDGGITVRLKRIDAGYVDTLDIPLVAGRGIAATDRPGGPPVVIINEALAARFVSDLGVTDAVGAIVRMSLPGYEALGEPEDVEVVGVIRNERTQAPHEAVPDVAYVPLMQVPRRELKLVVRTHAAPATVVSALRHAVSALDPNIALGDVRTMEEVKTLSLTGARQPTWVVGAFAMLAAALAALGLYGVLSHTVTQQRREYGVRLALGALPRDVVIGVVRHAFAMVAIGLLLGALGIVPLARLMATLLYDTSPVEPWTVATALGGLAVTAGFAAWFPARRASRVNPAEVLRSEG